MNSKFVLLFLLIAGAFATENNFEEEEEEEEEEVEERAEEPEVHFDGDAQGKEDYDDVKEDDERDLGDDMKMLDKNGMAEIKAFCANAANAGDAICKFKM